MVAVSNIILVLLGYVTTQLISNIGRFEAKRSTMINKVLLVKNHVRLLITAGSDNSNPLVVKVKDILMLSH